MSNQGWLKEELEVVVEDMKTWPDWMKRKNWLQEDTNETETD